MATEIKRKSIQKSAIVKYWYDVWENACKNEERQKLPKFIWKFCIDLGEPRCWACGVWQSSWDYCNHPSFEKWEKRDDMKGLFQNWNRLPLQKCHIVPFSLSHNDEPSNFVLMCNQCHRESPDTASPSMLFEWMDNREKFLNDKFSEKWNSACSQLGVDSNDLVLKVFYAHAVYKDELDKYVDENISIHWSEDGPEIPYVSILSAKIEFLKTHDVMADIEKIYQERVRKREEKDGNQNEPRRLCDINQQKTRL